MTHKERAITKHPGAKAHREGRGQGFTIFDATGNRMAWAPGIQEAWRIASNQPGRESIA